jgi:hypothetical protein
MIDYWERGRMKAEYCYSRERISSTAGREGLAIAWKILGWKYDPAIDYREDDYL